jgi:hypothetical protein
MARIRVYRSEADGESFPRMCMRCGRPAECDVPQTFAWMPGWVHIFILVGLLPWLIVALIMRKTMHVVAPMCRQHAGHWRVRRLYIWLGLLFFIATFIAIVAVGDRVPENVKNPIIFAALMGGLVWLVSGLIFVNGAIKASEIRDRGMDLVNVNRDFADVWNDMAE